jgi:predicted metalloendopeptidase
MDFTVSPHDNFYLYANGNWMKENPIPSGYPSWNTFLSLHVKSQENLKQLLEDLSGKQLMSDDELKVQRFYAAALDEEQVENVGLGPMKPLMDHIDITVEAYLAQNWADYCKCLGQFLSRFGMSPFLNIGASPDNTNSEHTICQVAQGGLGLPDRDYYFDEDKQEKRDAYLKHVDKMLQLLLGSDAEAAAEALFNEIELPMAEKHMTKTENRDPEKTYNKMSVQDLQNKICAGSVFDFEAFFDGVTGGVDLGDINVRNKDALERMASTATTVSASTLKSYLQWCAVRFCAPYLGKAFVDENFDFFERTLSGTQEIKPRWKRAMAFTESALGEALGQLYCAKYFDEDSKERALAIVESVRQALEERLNEVDWMKSNKTRENALKKMNRFRVKIGKFIRSRPGQCFSSETGSEVLCCRISGQMDRLHPIENR